MAKKPRTNLTERISVRCTKQEKEDLRKLIDQGVYGTEREFFKYALQQEVNAAQIACSMQNICNHLNITADPVNGVKLNGNKDEYIEKETKRIWEAFYKKTI